MNLWYLIGFFPWVIVMITCLARLDDIKRSQNTKRWHVRRIGLILSFTCAVCVLAEPFAQASSFIPEGSWLRCAIGYAWSMQLVTTPGMPPWHLWISGHHREIDPNAPPLSFGQLVGNEFRGLRNSFKNRMPGDRRSGKERRADWPQRG